MILQPDFLEHWKTRQLIEITCDESAPLAVLRLWGHCQNSKRGIFHDMTSAQLASICKWGKRSPACHTALIKCKFVEKLSPRGFIAHEWADHNRQLIQKWEAGKNGGRPRNDETPNESAPPEKPTDNRPITGRELDRTDGLDQIDKKEKNRTDLKDSTNGAGGSGSGSLLIQVGSSPSSVPDLTAALGRQFTAGCYPEGGEPSLDEVKRCMENRLTGAGQYAEKWLKTIKQRQWKDANNNPVMKWKPLAESWADGCARQERGVSKRFDRNAGTYNAAVSTDALKRKVR